MSNNPCDSFTGRKREICLGVPHNMPRSKRRAYVVRWLADGTLASDPDVVQTHEPAKAAEPSEPGILRKASNLARAIVRHSANGFRRTSDAEYQERLAICSGCEFFGGKPDKPSCRRCGCRLLHKLRWAGESCPLGLWTAIPSARVETPDETTTND